MRTPRNEHERTPIYYVGAIGNHRSGKTTGMDRLASTLEEVPGLYVMRVNMADALRDAVSESLPYRPDSEKRHDYERNLLQMTGEMWRRIDRNHWTRKALHEPVIERDVLHFDRDGSPKAIVAISADTYNWNEMFAMDHLVAVRNTEASLEYLDPDQAYIPETIRQTNFVLANANFFEDMFEVDGLIRMDSFQVSHPAEFNNEQVITRLANSVLRGLNTKLAPFDVRFELLTEAIPLFAGEGLGRSGLPNTNWPYETVKEESHAARPQSL